MITLELALQIISLIPPLHFGTPAAPVSTAPGGSGVLLIASCRPGATILVEPGHLQGVVDASGVAQITAPAQADGADSYQIYGDESIFKMHGTLSAHESLSAACP